MRDLQIFAMVNHKLQDTRYPLLTPVVLYGMRAWCASRLLLLRDIIDRNDEDRNYDPVLPSTARALAVAGQNHSRFLRDLVDVSPVRRLSVGTYQSIFNISDVFTGQHSSHPQTSAKNSEIPFIITD